MKNSQNDEPMLLETGPIKQTKQLSKNNKNKNKDKDKEEQIDAAIKFFLEDGIKDVEYIETLDKIEDSKIRAEEKLKSDKEKLEREKIEKQILIDNTIRFFLEDGIKDIKTPTNNQINQERIESKKEKPEAKKEKSATKPQTVETPIFYENSSIEYLSNKLSEEKQSENLDPIRIQLIQNLLFNRISSLTMREQILLMKSSENKLTRNSPTYKAIRDNVLLNLMDKFVEKKYRQSLTLTPETVETKHLGSIQKFVSALSSDQVEALKKINRQYTPPVASNSPEFYHFKEATKGIQATIDHSIDARGPGNNIYEDLQNDMDKFSYSNQYEKLQKLNNPIDIYRVSNYKEVETAKKLADEIKQKTGTHYQIYMFDELVMDSHEADKYTKHTNDMYDAHVMEKNFTGNKN